MGVGAKRKEDPSSSNLGKKQDGAEVIRTKARMGHLVRQSR